MKRAVPRSLLCAAATAAMLAFGPHFVSAQQSEAPPPQGVSRGENFSAKPAPALFNSDCTGSGCHKGPQGLAKGQSQSGLTSFLREHYTNSRESAAALAAYLVRAPAAPAEKETRAPRGSSRAAARPEPSRPEPSRTEPSRTETARPEEGTASAPVRRNAEPAEKPAATARAQRGRHTTAATPPAAPSEPAPSPAAAPPPPAPQYDIFD
jgi:hypothetical protein